jgi:hypothetical protein
MPLVHFTRLCGIPCADYADHLSAINKSTRRTWPPLQSITQRVLADRPQPISTSHGLCFPTAHEGLKVHLTRALPARYVPPSGFGYPLDGLRPSNPCRFCFAPAALMGLTLRSFLLGKGSQDVSTLVEPTYRFTCRYTLCRSTGPARQAAVPGFDPFESPWRPVACLVHGPLAAPLGLTLLRYSIEGFDQDFARSPLARFARRTYARPPASQSFDQPSLRPHPTLRQAARRRMKQPL